jgi:hypothetical protein
VMCFFPRAFINRPSFLSPREHFRGSCVRWEGGLQRFPLLHQIPPPTRPSVRLSVIPSILFAHLWTQPACGAAKFLCSF